MSLQTSQSSHRFYFLIIMIIMWGIGRQRTVNRLGNLLPQDDQESLVVRDKVGRPPGQLGMCKFKESDTLYLQCFDTVGWATGRACK